MTLPPCYTPPDGEDERADDAPEDPSRRAFVIGSAAAAAGAFMSPLLGNPATSTIPASKSTPVNATKVTLDVNGNQHELLLDPRTTLLDALREHLDLTGIDGRRYNSCLTLAVVTALLREEGKYSSHAFGAQFAEVAVDPDLGTIRMRRMVSAFAGGRILNAKTARSQFLGGIIQGIGMALLEQTHMDKRYGSFTNVNFGEYLVPVNADIPPIDVILVEENDLHVNPIGAKGIGEIGIVGVAPAIANAVFHATGKRVRDLPITIEKVM